jgi:hypothetical protein
VLISDGYGAYAEYAKKVRLTHAHCWAHARREVYEARDIEPAQAEQALEQIAEFYKEDIRARNLTGSAKLGERQCRARPKVQAFLRWADQQFE